MNGYLVVAGLITVGFAVWNWRLDCQITSRKGCTPHQVDLQRAGTPEAALRLLEQWKDANPKAVEAAQATLRQDMLLAASYGVCLALLIPRFWWVPIGAAIADICEDFCALRLLDAKGESPWPQATSFLAAVKFALLGCSVLLCLVRCF